MRGGHAIAVIGYDDDNHGWICKNSRGRVDLDGDGWSNTRPNRKSYIMTYYE